MALNSLSNNHSDALKALLHKGVGAASGKSESGFFYVSHLEGIKKRNEESH